MHIHEYQQEQQQFGAFSVMQVHPCTHTCFVPFSLVPCIGIIDVQASKITSVPNRYIKCLHSRAEFFFCLNENVPQDFCKRDSPINQNTLIKSKTMK